MRYEGSQSPTLYDVAAVLQGSNNSAEVAIHLLLVTSINSCAQIVAALAAQIVRIDCAAEIISADASR